MARWWILGGVLAMTLLGQAVGHASTPLDDWFHAAGRSHRILRRLLVFTDPLVLATLGVIIVAVALARRRWRLAAVVAVSPLVAIAAARLLKQAFGREDQGALAYPSGHTTVAVVVFGLAVLVAGGATWAIVAATVASVLAGVGQGVTYHYFTDAIGAVFLATALLCAAAWAAGLDRCQARCDRDHSGG